MSMQPSKESETILQVAVDNVEIYRKGNAKLRFVTSAGEPVTGLEVCVAQVTQDFLFGNLIFDLVWGENPCQPDLFKQRFLELFNLAIFPFYWPFYEKIPGQMEWARLIPALEWCLANGVVPKGHPLVWPYSAGIPEWLYDMPPEKVEILIQARVLNIVKGFKPYIQIWDVTNEGVNHISWAEATNLDFRDRYHETDLWRGIPVSGAFKRQIPIKEAADWVAESFRWAYAANPKATLIVNDYNQEYDPKVRQRFYDLVRELQDRDVPVSGLGLQMHPINHWLWPHEIWNTLEMYAELDCPVHITELHQPSWEQKIEGGFRDGVWSERAQAEFIEQVYRQCFGHPAVVSINYWGFSDRRIWIQKAGLIDEDYCPKPAFDTLKNLIKGEWLTHPFTAQTDENGVVAFRGFYGGYELVLPHPTKQHRVYKFNLQERQDNDFTFYIH